MIDKIIIKIDFTDFWTGFDKRNNMFFNLLSEKYTVIISDNPDLLFYSVYSSNHIDYRCTKIFYTGENQRPNFSECDFAFSFDHIQDKRNYRLPLYVLWADINVLLNRNKNVTQILAKKKKFCCFVVSNDKCDIRNEFFQELSKYKQVDSGGAVLNNIGGLVENKRRFIKDYKFVISFENSSYPGYTTEKVFEALVEDCLPIYWGNPMIDKDFNIKSMINCHEYPSFKEVIDHIKAVDDNDELYMQYLSEPAFTDNRLNGYVKKENILSRLDEIVAYHINNRLKLIQITRPLNIYIKSKARHISAKVNMLNNIIKLRFSEASTKLKLKSR
ncbi:MAG: hypothetical protein JWN56_1429 [Sphingobacteriales bacterium]|nr:hypothetical protein [Sphingobacteriales bacterium]